MRSCTRSIACPARRSASTSAGDLVSRNGRDHVTGEALLRAGQRVLEPQHLLRPHPVGQPDPGRRTAQQVVQQTRHQRVGVVGLAVASIRTRSRAGVASAAGRSSSGTTSTGSPRAGSTRQVSRSSGRAA